jgi:hypothetical protein
MITTADIDDPVLIDLKKLQKKEGKSLGRLIPTCWPRRSVTANP